MLAVGAAVLMERWRETFQHVEESLARDRRIDGQWRSPDLPAELKAQLPIKPPAAQEQDGQEAMDAAA